MPTQRVGLLHRFGLENGYTLCHFGLESGMVSRELQESTNVFIFFNSKMGKKEREICNDDIIS